MVIVEVTELSFDYASLDEKSLKFLKNAFKGANAVLVGEDGVRTVAVEDLKLFDPLQSILNISPSLKIANVVDGMGATMEKYGLLEFKVSQSGKSAPAVQTAAKTDAETIPIGSPAARKRFEVKKEEVKQFLASMEKAVSDREQSNLTVEEMLDNGRQGKFSSKGVEKMVEEILDEGTTPAMKAIAGLRGSDQTYAHCTDMSVILQECYVDILERGGREPSPANRRFALIAGFMHDIGKSEVPKDILESTDRFPPDSQEMILMRNHTTYGSRILSDMGMPNITINVAH
ncbi:MAG: HD domain-containing protein, partial [bacterium]